MTLGTFAAAALAKHQRLHGYYCTDPHGALQIVTWAKWFARNFNRSSR